MLNFMSFEFHHNGKSTVYTKLNLFCISFFFFLEKLAHLKGYVNNYRDQNKTPKLVSLSENIMHYFLFIVPIMTLLEYI